MDLRGYRSTVGKLRSDWRNATPAASSIDNSLLPYARQAITQDTRAQGSFQPLKMVLDLLQRGQYLTANIADEVEQSFRSGTPLDESTLNVLKAAFQGLTGQRKGDWEQLLFGGDIEGEGPVHGWLPENLKAIADEPLIKWGGEGTTGIAQGILRPRKAIGLAANVLLDPLTYVGLGPAKATQVAARAFAEDVVHLTAATLARNPEELAKIIGTSIEGIAGKAPKEIASLIASKGGNAGKRFMEDTYNRAFKQALLNPSEVLMKGIESRLGQAKSIIGEDVVKNLPPGALSGITSPLEGAVTDVSARPLSGAMEGLEALVQRMSQGYAGTGRYAGRFMGKETFNIAAPGPVRQWDALKSSFGESPIGGKFSDAWWSVMNRGPVGTLRKALGFRNPYEKMLRAKEMDVKSGAEYLTSIEAGKLAQAKEGMTPEDLQQALQIRADAESMNKAAMETQQPAVTVYTILSDPQFFPGYKLNHEQAQKLIGFWQKMDPVVGGMFDSEIALAAKVGVPSDMVERLNYIPQGLHETSQAIRSATPKAEKVFTTNENIDQAVGVWKWLLGDDLAKMAAEKGMNVDDFTRQWVKENDLAWASVDIEKAFTYRAIQHAKLMTKYNMIDQFRQFGIPISEIVDSPQIPDALRPQIAARLGSAPRDIPELGLYKISAPNIPHPVYGSAFDGYLFDKEVADVINRAIPIIDGDAGTAWFKGIIGKYTTWWKGMVTLTTGFHARNFMSNTISGFLNFGPRWFEMNKWFGPTMAGTFYALHPENYMDLIKGTMNVTDGWIARQLNKRIGPFSIKELADHGAQVGLISHRTQAGLEELAGKTSGSWNPLSPDNKAFRASQAVGEVVENSARVQAYLMNFSDLAAKETGAATDVASRLAQYKSALEYSSNESKRIFLDYGDLTDFERNVMRKVIPFYCVPENAEILTRKGWKTYSDIDENDYALTYNMEIDRSEWQPVLDISVFPFDGELVRLKGQIVDILSTENHRWPVERNETFVKGKWYGGDIHILDTNELNTNHKLIMSAPYEATESILSPWDARLLGWLVTDGYIRWRGNHMEAMIYQSPKKYADEIRDFLGSAISSESIHPLTGVICFRIKVSATGRLRQVFRSKADVPGIVTRLDMDALSAIYDAMLKAEGSVGHIGTTREFTEWSQTNGPILDSFQIVCQLLNKPYSFREKAPFYSGGYVRKGNRIKVSYLRKSKVHYTGMVWCPHTKNGTWIMRQNGTALCTGNSWLRKNTANQINGILNYPEMWSIIPKTQGAIKSDENFDYSLQPEYAKNLGMYPVGTYAGGKSAIMFNPNFPIQDVNKLPLKWEEGALLPSVSWQEALDDVMSAAHPILKTVVELATGRQLWYKQAIPAKDRAPTIFQYLSNAGPVLQFLDGIMRAAGFADGIKLDVKQTLKGEVRDVVIDGRVNRLLENNLPVLKTLGLLIETPETALGLVNPDLEKWIHDVSGKQDLYKGLEKVFQLASSWGGVKFKEFDMEQQQQQKAQQLYSDALKLRREATAKLPGQDVKKLNDARKAALAAEKRMRRLGLYGS